MNLQRITDSLAALFATQSIVFWHDSEGEFLATIDNLVPDNVNLVRLHETAALDDGVKVNYAKFGDLLAEVKAVTGSANE